MPNDTTVVTGQDGFCQQPALLSRGMGWNPWRHLADHYPHIEVRLDRELPGRVWGTTIGNRIWLCRLLDQAARRSTLTHEIVHLERGPVPADARGHAREERAVSAEAARRLIPLDALADGLRWSRDDPHQLAEALWVDVPTLKARMESLDPIEVAQLENALDGQWTP
jgi:hypothetical protein